MSYKLRAKVVKVIRRRNTASGNPRWQFILDYEVTNGALDGTWHFSPLITAPDSACSLQDPPEPGEKITVFLNDKKQIENYERRGEQ